MWPFFLSFLFHSQSVAPSFGIRLRLSDRELGLRRSLAAAAAAAFLYDDREKENASRKELIAAGVYLTWLKNTLIIARACGSAYDLENVNVALVVFVYFSLSSLNVINIEQIRKYEIHAKIGPLESLGSCFKWSEITNDK